MKYGEAIALTSQRMDPFGELLFIPLAPPSFRYHLYSEVV